MDTQPLNLGMIAAYYYISYTTIGLSNLSTLVFAQLFATAHHFRAVQHVAVSKDEDSRSDRDYFERV